MTGGGKRTLTLSQYKEKKRFSPISPRYSQPYKSYTNTTKTLNEEEVNSTEDSNYGEYFCYAMSIYVLQLF